MYLTGSTATLQALLTNSIVGLHSGQEALTNCECHACRRLFDFLGLEGVCWSQTPWDAHALGHSLASDQIRAWLGTCWVLRIVGGDCCPQTLCKLLWWQAIGAAEYRQPELANFLALLSI